MYLWVNAAADGEEWVSVNLAAAHNVAVGRHVGWKYCESYVNDNLAKQDKRNGICRLSMSYNSIVATGKCSGIVLYDQLKFQSAKHPECNQNTTSTFALPFVVSHSAACEADAAAVFV